MVSVSHPHARDLFERDAAGVARFFEGKLGVEVGGGVEGEGGRPRPVADWARARARAAGGAAGDLPSSSATDGPALDVALAASGFRRKHEAELEEAFAAARAEREEEEEAGGGSGGSEGAGGSSSGEEEGEEEEEGAASLVDLRDRLQLGGGSGEEEEEGDGEEDVGGGPGSLDRCASSGGEGEGATAPVAAAAPAAAVAVPPSTPALDRATAVAARLKAEAARAAKAAAAGRAARGAKAASSRAKRRETAGGAK